MNKYDVFCEIQNSKSLTAKALFNKAKLEHNRGKLKKRNLVWLELTGCSGNIISLLNGENPDFNYLVMDMVNLVYNNSLMAQEGEAAIESLIGLVNKEFILVVEGAVATKDQGLYHILGRWRGKPLTALEVLKNLGEKASQVIAIGACATHGGVSAAEPNPALCVSVQSLLKRKVIKLPGCPCHPDWIMGILSHLLVYGEPKLDSMDRPRLFYNVLIHDRCPRRMFFDRGIFASILGEATCMFKLGCRGPVTPVDCPIRKWNSDTNWPIEDNTPCIGCAQFGFPDRMTPFISYNTTREV